MTPLSLRPSDAVERVAGPRRLRAVVRMVRADGHTRTATCPNHPDRDVPLTVSRGDTRIELACSEGCSTDVVRTIAGMHVRELALTPYVPTGDWTAGVAWPVVTPKQPPQDTPPTPAPATPHETTGDDSETPPPNAPPQARATGTPERQDAIPLAELEDAVDVAAEGREIA